MTICVKDWLITYEDGTHDLARARTLRDAANIIADSQDKVIESIERLYEVV